MVTGQLPNELPKNKLNTNILASADVPSAPDIDIGIPDSDELGEIDLIFGEIPTADSIPLRNEITPLIALEDETEGKDTPVKIKSTRIAKNPNPKTKENSLRKKALGLFRESYRRIKQDWEWDRGIFVKGNTNAQMDKAFDDLWPKYSLADFQLLYDCLKERKEIGVWNWNPNTVERHMLATIGKPLLEEQPEEPQYIDTNAMFEEEMRRMEEIKKNKSEYRSD
jgi:hypothetical protein